MKKSLALILMVSVGLVLGWVAQEFSGTAAAQQCATENGDVNGDGGRDIADAVYLLSWLFTGGPEPEPICPLTAVSGIPDTGQTTCYDGVVSINSSHAHLAVVVERTVHAEVR